MKFTRDELKTIVKYLSTTYDIKKSIAPRSAVARLLEKELNQAGIPHEDHVLFVMNHFPETIV